MLTLKIIGGILALFLGIWLGLPGRYDRRSEEELAKLLEDEGGRRKSTRRHFMYLDWFRKEEKASHRRRQRRHFRTAAPAPRPRDATDG